MKNIDINQLTDIDFEEFSRDILSFQINKTVRGFKQTKDKGIDGLVLNEENWIMQAKCYKGTPYSTMLSNLKKEREKVKKLNPKNYFLFINKELTVGNYEEILKIFRPYLKKENLYDQHRIKDILNKKEAEYILEKWDKLWLPTPYFIDKFYEKFKKSKYEYEKSQMIEEAKIFVETDVYKKAKDLLEKKNVILIHGEPGAGKTTLARRLALKYIYKGYELLYEHAADIKGIEDYLYDRRKKIIIVDDFLGQSTLELREISDNILYNIISYARKNKNVKLILTTRSYIYNNSKHSLEKFSESAERLGKLLIEVKEYSEVDKGKILYNHLYYNDLIWTPEYLEILKDNYYERIVNNRNYTPRNIAKICEIIKEDRPDNVIETINKLLNNPDRIWKHEYDKLDQSKYGKYEKILLDLICFFKYDVKEEVLKKQFENILKDNDEYDDEIFYKSIEELSNAFVSSSFNGSNEKSYKFINPSMEDFLRKKAKNNKCKMKKYIDYLKEMEYLYDFYELFYDDIEMKEYLKQRVMNIINEEQRIKYSDRTYLFRMFNGYLTEEQKKLMKILIDDAFDDLYNYENIEFILEVLEIEYLENASYQYALELFKQKEIKSEYYRYQIANGISEIWEWETYINIFKRIFKKRNPKHLKDLIYLMVEDIKEYIAESIYDIIEDEIEEVYQDLQKGKTVEDIYIENVYMAVDMMELYKVFTPDIKNQIIEQVIEETYIDEEWIEECVSEYEKNEQENKEKEEDGTTLEQIFQINSDETSIIEKYIIRNIDNQKSVEELLKQKEKWYINSFFNDIKSIRMFTNFINKINYLPTNPIEMGEQLINYMSNQKTFYRRKEKQIYELIKEFIKSDRLVISIKNPIIKKYEEIINQMKMDNILLQTEQDLYFINNFFILYFIRNQIFLDRKNEDYINDFRENNSLELLNLSSYCSIKNFNEYYIKTLINSFTRYIINKDKYTISKSYIEKLCPSIYINIIYNTFTISREYKRIFDYIGINMSNNLANFPYYKIKKCLEEKYSVRNKKEKCDFVVDFKKVIRDNEAVEEFEKLKVWDYFEEVYNKLLIIKGKLQENDNIDFYMYFNNTKEFDKYLDTDKRENIYKYF